MSEDPMYSRCIERAAAHCGGLEQLAIRLDINPLLLSYWMQGRGRPSDSVFLKIVDIVLALPPELARPARGQDIAEP